MDTIKRAVKKYTLRDVTEGDREFLLEVYAAARAMELSVLPWDDAMKRAVVEHQFDAQTAHDQEHYPAAEHTFILVDGEDAGRLYVDRADTQMIALLDITVLERYRRRGVGKVLVGSLLADGAISNRIVRVYTEEFNPGLALFTSLGFEVTEKDGFLLRLDAEPLRKT